jgi:hypothetical protein
MRGRSLLSTINTQLSALSAQRTKYTRANSRSRPILVRAHRWIGFFPLALLFASLPSEVAARKHPRNKAPHKEQQSSAQIEGAARLQIFLDRSNQLRIPNVPPFELGQVKELKPGSEINAPVASELPDELDKTPAFRLSAPDGE